MDKIYIRDLALRCIIGIYPDERKERQDIIINVTLQCESFAAAAATDDIQDTVDYKQLKKQIIKLVDASAYNLIETMADHIAALCLEDPRVSHARVVVDKPGALRFARSVAVEVNRSRGH